MEPRLNIKIADLFDGAPSPVDVDFIQPGQQDLGSPFDVESDYSADHMRAVLEQRQGIGEHLDRNVQVNGESLTHNPAQDENLMVLEPGVANTKDLSEIPGGAGAAGNTLPHNTASKIKKQANGFNTTQANPDFTMGVVASVNKGTLVSSRVVVETPSTKVAGTVIAVGDREFAVVWDDRTASVERKADYELVFAQ